MPEKVLPSGIVELTNLNAGSTHPNPWKPPQPADLYTGTNQACYKIYHWPMEKVWQNAASHTNFVKEGPLTDRLRTWTFKGFWLGKLCYLCIKACKST